MAYTLENYQAMTIAQRNRLKRDELKQLVDDQLNEAGDIATLRGVIRDELQKQTSALETALKAKYDSRIKAVEDENDRLKKENAEIKKAVSEQQRFLERVCSEKNMDNIFISGIPIELEIDDNSVDDANTILHHVLKFVDASITPQNYKILKNFEPREGNTMHSAKVKCADQTIKKKVFAGCKKFRELPEGSPLRKIWIKNEDTPLQKKENDRLYTKFRNLKSQEDEENPVNIYKIKGGKLFKNDEVIDTFNLENQLFA